MEQEGSADLSWQRQVVVDPTMAVCCFTELFERAQAARPMIATAGQALVGLEKRGRERVVILLVGQMEHF